MSRCSSAKAFGGSGMPSGVRTVAIRAAALRRVRVKLRMPIRARVAFIRFTMRVRSPTRHSRSRLGLLASSSAIVGTRAMLQSRESERRWQRGEAVGRLDGVPVTIKDLLPMRGFPTLRGSRLVDRDQNWSEDAAATARLREAGAVILGKTTTPEFGWKALGDSPLTGITRNPWDLSRTPGGSSAGAAAACAAGIGPL